MKIYKCVQHGQLEHETRQGWALEQVLVHDHSINVPHQAPAQVVNNNNNGNYGTSFGSTVPVDTPVIVREPMFLLWKENDVILREEELTRLLKAEQEAQKKWSTDYDGLKRAHDTYKEEADRRTKEVGESIAVQRKMMTAKEKLEGDLVKVQKAIGDLKYFEIVGGPVPK